MWRKVLGPLRLECLRWSWLLWFFLSLETIWRSCGQGVQGLNPSFRLCPLSRGVNFRELWAVQPKMALILVKIKCVFQQTWSYLWCNFFLFSIECWKYLVKFVVFWSTYLCYSVWIPQASVQMSLCMASHLCLLVLPVMTLLLFSPIGWSYDALTPGCHLYRESRTVKHFTAQFSQMRQSVLKRRLLKGKSRVYG